MMRTVALALLLAGCAVRRPADASIAPPTRIVLGADATPAERAAAEMLARELRIEPAYSPGTSAGGTLFVGRSAELDARLPGIDWASLGGEGFVLETAGNDLVVAGGRPRGTVYGAEELLARLGRKVFATDCVVAPEHVPSRIPPLHVHEVPRLEYREPLFTEAFDPVFAVANRANGEQSRLGEKEGGSISYARFVHTLYEIVPPSKYFAEHPEYFALVDGKRVGEGAQLCLTNPDVLAIAVDTVKGWLRASPQASIVSVSQNDCFRPCACDACRAIDDREGSHAGSLLAFVNAIAEAIEPEFPDKAVDTLAYQYTRKPPRTIRPRKNVIVRLCSIECCFAHPLATCEKNASFRDDLVAWSRLTDRLYVWDYATNFAHYLQPLPNVGVLAANVRFYADHGVRGIFEEGDYAPGGGGEMARLKSWLVARAMWDPSVDAAAVRAEFLAGYFREAAEPMARWLDRLAAAVANPGVHATIYDPPTAAYLSDDVLRFGEERFAEAEKLARSAVVRARVKAAGLGIRYVRLVRATPEKRKQILPSFAADARAAGITMTSEGEKLDAFVERLGK
jgi:hypothetical protein